MARVGIIGAGLSGLIVARALSTGHDVVVFEKSRGAGGRMATRYAGDFEFDHGTQFFTARSARFREFLAPLVEAGHVAAWEARFAEMSGPEMTATRRWDNEYPHFVGAPRMNVIGKHLAEGLDVRRESRVSAIARTSDGWALTVVDAAGVKEVVVDSLVVTAPLAQALELLPEEPALASAAGSREMLGCYALMLGFDASPALPFDAALVRNADVSWMSVNSSKPGRAAAPTVVVHATNRWAEAHMDMPLESVRAHMVAEASRVADVDLSVAVHQEVQRWRYANAPKASDDATFFIDAARRLGVAGDWWIRGRVEAAFTSGEGLAKALAATLV